MNKILIILSVVFFSGCSFDISKPQTPQRVSKIEMDKKEIVVKKIPKVEQSIKKEKKDTGMIRGVIKSLKYMPLKGSWQFEVSAVDTTNGKLSSAIFESVKSLYDEGDLIYATLKKGLLQEIHLIKKRYHALPTKVYKEKKVIKKNLTKIEKSPKKRTKKRQVLSLPKEESISLD